MYALDGVEVKALAVVAVASPTEYNTALIFADTNTDVAERIASGLRYAAEIVPVTVTIQRACLSTQPEDAPP